MQRVSRRVGAFLARRVAHLGAAGAFEREARAGPHYAAQPATAACRRQSGQLDPPPQRTSETKCGERRFGACQRALRPMSARLGAAAGTV
jgi:hypothetical protein